MNHACPVVVLVEDDHDTRILYQALLSAEGMEVITFAEGWPFLDWFAQQLQKPDLLILDMRLPDTNGLELCREFRRIYESSPPIPIMLLSAHGDPRMPASCRQAGGTVFLDKLRDLDQMVPTAQRLLGRAGS